MFRTNPQMLLEYHEMQMEFRSLYGEDSPETCFDDLGSLLEGGEDYEC